MAKKVKPKEKVDKPKVYKEASMSIFDHLENMTSKKTPWSSYTESDRKSFSPYMINKWLSMEPECIELVNTFQRYTLGGLESREVYKLYSALLPRQKIFLTYIKGKKSDVHNQELIDLVSKHYLVSNSEAITYLDIATGTIDGLEFIESLLERYGYDEKKIKKVMK